MQRREHDTCRSACKQQALKRSMRSLSARFAKSKIIWSTLRLIPVLLEVSKATDHCHSTERGCKDSTVGNLLTQGEEQNFENRKYHSGMEWRSNGRDNDDLISQLKNYGIIKSGEVEKAMHNVDRGNYCPRSPYQDSPQPIGFGVTISAPHMHAHALEILKNNMKEGNKVLDVGSGRSLRIL